MERGYIKFWRKSKESSVFATAGLWKLWCLCLMKAAYKETEVIIQGILKPIKLKPGQFITGRYSLHYDYHQGDKKKRYSRKASPTEYSLIRWLLTLQEMQMLSIKTFNKYSIITILNWELYQENEQQASNRRASSKHKEEGKKKYKRNPEKDFSYFRERYSDQDLIDRASQAIASTRKSGKVADSVLLVQLQKWGRYPIQQVEAGIRIYLEKNYADEGKDEKYLYGIIRRLRDPKNNPPASPPKTLTIEEIEEMNRAN